MLIVFIINDIKDTLGLDDVPHRAVQTSHPGVPKSLKSLADKTNGFIPFKRPVFALKNICSGTYDRKILFVKRSIKNQYYVAKAVSVY